jgi:hypothetical protein
VITSTHHVIRESGRSTTLRRKRPAGLQAAACAAALAAAVACGVPDELAAQTVSLAYTDLQVLEGESFSFEVLAPPVPTTQRFDDRMRIRRDGDLTGTTRGRLLFHPGSASEGEDYLLREIGHRWQVLPGERFGFAFLPFIVHDGLVEDPEDFFVELVVDEGGSRGEPYLARVTILDRPRIEISIESLPPVWGGFSHLRFRIVVRNLGGHELDDSVLHFLLDSTLRHDAEECETENEGWSPLPGAWGLFRTLAIAPWSEAVFHACAGVSGIPASRWREHLVTVEMFAPPVSATIWIDETLAPCADPAGTECCVARAIACVLHPSHCDTATAGAETTLLGRASGLLRRAAGLVPRFFQFAGDVALLYRVRHELERTDEGRRLVELYYEHSQALKEVIFGDLDLLFETSALLDAWRRPLEALSAEAADREIITPVQIDRLVAYLDALEAAAGPELRQVIAQERVAHDFQAFAGLTVGQALTRATTPPPSPCVPSSEVACLLGGRFEVRVDWQTADATGTGKVMFFGGQRAESDESVFMWFFDPGNFEMGIKMVDACVPPFGKFWAFQSGLTNQGYTVRIRDSVNDAERIYSNPRGTLPTTTADTAAFDCP